MKPLRYGIVVTCLVCGFFAAHAQPAQDSPAKDLIIEKNKIFDPEKLSLDSLHIYEKNFTYDWTNYASIAPNQRKIQEIEDFLRNTPPEEFKKLNSASKQALGKMLFKLGTYYTHIEQQPDRAIRYLNSANKFLIRRTDKAWTYNHLAYAYEEKFVRSEDEVDQKQGLFFINKALQFATKNSRETAFNYCIKGLLENAASNFKQAEINYKTALDIYEKIAVKNEQYQRARTDLAAIMLANDDNDKALAILQSLKSYWQGRGEININPFAARNLLVLGEAYLKLGKPEKAHIEIKQAVNIYENVYGKNNPMLIYPYQLLADAYKILGKKQLADTYQIQANSLDNS